MSNSTDPIKILADRFSTLPASVRMGIATRLLELRDSDQAAIEAASTAASSFSMVTKSLLEHFWDEVENAHGDGLNVVNPFTQERALRVLEVEAVDVTEGCCAVNSVMPNGGPTR